MCPFSWQTGPGVATTTTIPSMLLATIGDPDGARTVTSIIALLVALGLGLAMLAVWLRRTTRPDPELLAPLEKMGERRWRRADPVAQRRALDEIRPRGAVPLTPSAAPPQVDEAFDAGPTASGFDDLSRDEEPDTPLPPPAAPVGGPLMPPATSDTPKQIDRPEEFGDDIDPELLAAAQAELDAELRRQADAP